MLITFFPEDCLRWCVMGWVYLVGNGINRAINNDAFSLGIGMKEAWKILDQENCVKLLKII